MFMKTQIIEDGFALVPDLATASEADNLLAAIEAAQGEPGARHGSDGVYAMRNLLQVEVVREWTQRVRVQQLLGPILGDKYFPVRGILFDKTPGSNWKVGWHQDLSIAVQKRVDVPAFGPWSEKAGVTHVQPPREVLETMLTVRLHLDECGENNGPLRVVPASHLDGKLAPEAIQEMRRQNGQVICTLPRGGALLMRPLLLHASSPATSPHHRRIVHIEFASQSLPGGLEWN
jgi:hypothetical protein